MKHDDQFLKTQKKKKKKKSHVVFFSFCIFFSTLFSEIHFVARVNYIQNIGEEKK